MKTLEQLQKIVNDESRPDHEQKEAAQLILKLQQPNNDPRLNPPATAQEIEDHKGFVVYCRQDRWSESSIPSLYQYTEMRRTLASFYAELDAKEAERKALRSREKPEPASVPEPQPQPEPRPGLTAADIDQWYLREAEKIQAERELLEQQS